MNLYTGPVVPKNVLSPDRYYHFLSLTVAMSIMLESDKSTCYAYLQYVHELMSHFVIHCADLYGNYFSVYNVRGLIHLHEAVCHFNWSLNDISPTNQETCTEWKKSPSTGDQAIIRDRIRNTNKSKIQPKTRPQMFVSTKEKDSCFLLQDERLAFIRERRGDGTVVCDVLHKCYTSALPEAPNF